MGMNASKFIEAYNIIDKTLRARYGIKANITYSELLRQTISKNYLVKKYEDELYDFGRLRNAIVHKSTDKIIAEPHDDVRELICHIADLMTTPPLVMDVVRKAEIIAFDSERNLYDLIDAIYQYNYTNVPVYKDNVVLGVVNSKQVVREVAHIMQQKNELNISALKKVKLSDIVRIDLTQYVFASTKVNIIDVMTMFNTNPRLKAVMITRTGTNTMPIEAVITSSDWFSFSNILDKL